MLTRAIWRTSAREVLPFHEIDQNITTESREGKRYYIVPGGAYPSITTILGETGEKGWLEDWRNRVGHENARKIGAKAATRGTHLHLAIEDFLNGKDVVPARLPYSTVSCMKGMLPFLERIGTIRYQETALWSHSLALAGRVDLCAEFDGEDAVIDFKGSTRMKEIGEIDDYFIQASAYSYMIEELTGVAVKKLVIIMGTEDAKGSALIGSRISYRHLLKQRLEKFYAR